MLPSPSLPFDRLYCSRPGRSADRNGQERAFRPANLNYPDALSGMVGDGVFVFDPARGLVYDDDPATTTEYDTVEMQFLSDDDPYALNVQVSATGRVKYCSGSAGAIAVPGYDPCN